jgi:hypothetical protein
MNASKEKIIKFMEAKRDMLWKTYFISKDKECIKKWNNTESEEVWQHIYKNKNDFFGVESNSCPFCIYYRYDCTKCLYRKHHNNKECSDNSSNFQKQLKENPDIKNSLSEEWFIKTIEKINDTRTIEEKKHDRQTKLLFIDTTLKNINTNVETITKLLKEVLKENELS